MIIKLHISEQLMVLKCGKDQLMHPIKFNSLLK